MHWLDERIMPRMRNRMFGTDGIRGKAGVYPLDEAGLTKIGRAIGKFFEYGQKPIFIAWDPRESSETIQASLTDAITSMGIDVMHLGILPTPGLAYLTNVNDVAAGIMITASHNPYHDNGIKIFLPSGNKLTDSIEDKINDLIETNLDPIGTKGSVTSDLNKLDEYVNYLREQANLPKRLKVAFDCANGAASTVITKLAPVLNVDAVIINSSPDGKNINHECGATDTKSLQKTVLEQACDLGFAYDGDADRLFAVDRLGNEINGDVIMYILAVTGNHHTIAATSMSNLGFENALKNQNIKLLRSDVGDRYVLETMHEHGLILGGEQSGHIILGRLATTGDGILASLVLLSDLIESGRSLDDWAQEIDFFPQAIVNIDVVDKTQIDSPEISKFIEEKNTSFAGEGRLVIRASGTEPKIRVMVEADKAQEQAKKIALELEKLFNRSAITEYPVDAEMQQVVQKISTAIRPDYIDQLINKSRELNIVKYTPKDSTKRFVDREHFDKWLNKGRTVHWLLSKSDDLAGIIWYGKADFPDGVNYDPKPEYTFAIRLYDGYQGHGLAVPFMKQSLKIFDSDSRDSGEVLQSIWLQTDVDNGAAIHVYSKVGYREITRDNKRVTMVIDRFAIDEIYK